MATDQFEVDSQLDETKPAPRRRSPEARRGPRRGLGVFILLIVAGLVGGGYYLIAGTDRERKSEHGSTAADDETGTAADHLPRVEAVKPKRGGMEMISSQPGTVHAFDYAQLYAKVSGYVKEIKVDRGSRVKEGDPLVELSVPELVAAVEQAKASLVRARASVVQAQAAVKSATQTIVAKRADEEKARSDLQAATAQREYRDKQFIRISELVRSGSVERRLQDEEQDRLDAAKAAEYSAKSGVAAARAHIAEAEAQLAKAEADVAGAEADVKVSQANLDKEMALESYTHIRSPYTGVVIFRGEAVHVGAFIQSADKGVSEPMLTVARDDRMRTVIPVPDRDVPYCDLGDPAIVRVDALHDREFKGFVSRIAESEDINDRTMRVEVDLDNPFVDPKGQRRLLRDGMYGRAEIVLEKATNHLTVPSKAVLGVDSEGHGKVEVVRDGKMYRQPVIIARDNGTLAEIVSGLDPDSMVIITPDISMADGTPVEVQTSNGAVTPETFKAAHS